MRKLNRHEIITGIAVILLIIAAMVCRFIGSSGFLMEETGWLRGIIQCGLAAGWYISIRGRILKSKMQQYLLAVAALVFFWLTERMIKYMLLKSFVTATRYFWYLYYIPLELIPLLGIFTALCMRQTENYRLPGKYRLLYIPALVMIAIVLTNDLHQLVFVFPGGILNSGISYTYGPLYPVVGLCILAEAAAMLVILWQRSSLPGRGKRVLIPFLPVLAGILYTAAYILNIPFVRQIAGDLTAVFCLVIVTTFELCIMTGLIPSNTHYDELFKASTIAAQIVDEDYHAVLSSDTSLKIPETIMRQTEAGPVMLSDSIRLSSAAIRGGHVLWTEDVSELTAVLQKLADNKETLENSNLVLEKNYQTAQHIRRLEEQNSLYDSIARQTSDQIELSSKLLKQYRSTEDEAEKYRLLGKLVVIGAYLKRRSNLIFIREQNESIQVRELELCLKESTDNLKLYGVQCGLYVHMDGNMPADAVMELYDFFEKTVEYSLDSLHSMLVRIFRKNGGCCACIDIECDRDLSGLADGRIQYSCDDEGTRVALMLSEEEMRE